MRLRRIGKLTALIAIVVLVAAACTTSGDFVGDTTTTAAGGGSGGDTGDTGDTGDDDGFFDDGGSDGGQEDSVDRPPPLRQSLAVLDSYRLLMTIRATGAQVGATDTTIEVDYAGQGGWKQTLTSNDPEFGASVTEIYWQDGVGCTVESGAGEPAPLAPQDREFISVFWNQMDFVPTVADPVLAGEEVYQGIPAVHYTFTVPGLGVQSGAVPTETAGDYWLAQDGGYLLGYRIGIQTRTGPESDPNAEVVDGEMLIQLSDINTPITITPPPDCAVPADFPIVDIPLGPGTGSGAAAADPDDLPLPISQGLAQLDSYRLEASVNVGGPELGQSSLDAVVEYSATEGGLHQSLTTVTDGEASTTETYWKDNVICNFEGGFWTPTEVTDQDQEFIGVFGGLMDFVPVVTDPVLVGTEDFQGISSRHYTFMLRGLHPTELGTTSSGEYWLADDGGYLVGYRASFGTPSASGAGNQGGDMSITLSSINGAVPITPPPECAVSPGG